MDQNIKELVRKHQDRPFPDGYRGGNIAGIDLVLLDADTAGCVLTYIADNGKLDLYRTAILGKCYRDLSIIVAKIDGEAHLYFKEWEIIAETVLISIIRDNISLK